jgi:hypothetical protein
MRNGTHPLGSHCRVKFALAYQWEKKRRMSAWMMSIGTIQYTRLISYKKISVSIL